jgi:DNA primase
VDPVQQIQERLSIIDVLRDYVTLVPNHGQNNFKCVCPFHDDHNPSMLINEQKGIAWCFVCNSGGGIFKFVQQIENCDFPEALRILAEKANVELRDYNPPDKKKLDEKEQLFVCAAEAANFFQKTLATTEHAQTTLAERHLPESILQAFQVGYAPQSPDALQKHLLKKGFNRQQMLTVGVTVTAEEQGVTRDKFRERLMFPLHNLRGQICGFSGRYIGNSDKPPKYLNSPQTPIYNKSATLYGYHLAKDEVRRQGFIILTEGLFDVLACHAAGLRNTVATCGTALTEQHAKLLKRSSKEVALCLDADDAGQLAARKSAAMLQRLQVPVTVIEIPGGKDPDEAIRSDVENFRAAVAQRQPAMEYFFRQAFTGRNVQNLPDKQVLLSEILPLLNSLPSALERDHYLQKLATDLQTNTPVLEQELSRWRSSNEILPVRRQGNQKKAHTYKTFDYFLGALIEYPELFSEVANQLLINYFSDSEAKTFYKQLLDEYNTAGLLSLDKIWGKLSPAQVEYWQVASVYTTQQWQNFKTAERQEEMQNLLRKLNKEVINQALTTEQDPEKLQTLVQLRRTWS